MKPAEPISPLRKVFPTVWDEVDTFLSSFPEEEARLLQHLYAGLDCHDLPSVTPEQMISYVHASQKALLEIPYAAQVPENLFYDYVLPPRVNNEWLDGSREWLLKQLLPRVRDKDILSAALEVNYWCCEQASYLPTDDRTIAPFGMCRRGSGRCGEESTLLTAALRAVGIPARQCYAPYWAHCDDNHAWVEFWAEDGWHFMGACEPEQKADEGWFLSAASKALLIRSRVPDPSLPEGYRTVNSTALYGATGVLTVLVTAQGQPVPKAQVRFQLINYSRIQTLHICITNSDGLASMELGLGSLIVSTCLNGVLVEQAVDLRQTKTVTLRKEDGFSPTVTERNSRWILNPPTEIIPLPPADDLCHNARLRQCEAHRATKRTPYQNAEIDRFLSLPQYTAEDKTLLLQTLTEKDLFDCTCQTLESFLSAALPYKHTCPLPLWQSQILAPRVEWEMLQPIRQELKELLAATGLSSRQLVLQWMAANILPVPEHGLTDRRGNAAGYLRHRRCPESEWDILAVQICRALGIPAALSPVDGKLHPESEPEGIPLTLRTREALMNEEEHFSLSRWNGDDYVPLHLGRTGTLLLPPGAYSLVTVRRQIDGTVSANVQRFLLDRPRETWLTPEPDETAQKLTCVSLPPVGMAPLTENGLTVSALASEKPSLLVFLQPGAEPTEHLLQELLTLADFCRFPIRFLLKRESDMENPTLQKVLRALPNCAAYTHREEDRFPIQSAAGIGDARLSLALALDSRQNIRYGCANYNIRSAATLLNILSLVE